MAIEFCRWTLSRLEGALTSGLGIQWAGVGRTHSRRGGNLRAVPTPSLPLQGSTPTLGADLGPLCWVWEVGSWHTSRGLGNRGSRAVAGGGWVWVFLTQDQRILRSEVHWGKSIPVAFTAVQSPFLTHSLPNKNHQNGINWAQVRVIGHSFLSNSFHLSKPSAQLTLP